MQMVTIGWVAAIVIRQRIMQMPWMAGFITLEDGNDVYASNMGLRGALESIAAKTLRLDENLSRWLDDVSKRGAGVMDFDLRGLNPDRRKIFWLGVFLAYKGFKRWDQNTAFSPAVATIRMLYDERAARKASVVSAVPPIDVTDLWFG